jgi:dephospho-CoA kinase
MLVLGVTGGIATGKSTVVGMLRELGAEVIDADEIAREVTQPGSEGARRIREQFGDVFFDENGSLRRRELGERVFADPAERLRLEAILHPLILDRIRSRIEALRAAAGAADRIVVVEAPLLIEAGARGLVDRILVVAAEQRTQRRRLTERGDYTAQAIAQRIASQMTQEEKLRYADYVINTDCPLAETRRQVGEVWEQLRGRRTGGGSGLR